jgi:hypothetical protein
VRHRGGGAPLAIGTEGAARVADGSKAVKVAGIKVLSSLLRHARSRKSSKKPRNSAAGSSSDGNADLHHRADNGLARSRSSACDLPLGGGGGADRGGVDAGAGAGAAGVGAGAIAAGAAGFSTTASPLRSSRIGTLIFMWACPIYRSHSWAFAWRRKACWSTSGSLLNRNTSDGMRPIAPTAATL